MNRRTQPLRSGDISISSPEIVNFAISRNANSFYFSSVFKDSFNRRGYHFDDVSKNGYVRFS